MASQNTSLSTHADGTYGIKSWDEKTWDGKERQEQPGAKLTHAKIVYSFDGDFKGEGNCQLVMTYRDDMNAQFLGLMHMVGKLGDRSGSFVVEVTGSFENGAATSTWLVIEGSGTDELQGLRGEGQSVARHGDTQPFTLDYAIEA